MAKENESVETQIAAAAAEVAASVPAAKDDDSKSEDAKIELFARKVSDAVTKSIAELLNPTKKSDPVPDDEEEVEEAGKKVRRKRKPPAAPIPKKRIFSFFG